MNIHIYVIISQYKKNKHTKVSNKNGMLLCVYFFDKYNCLPFSEMSAFTVAYFCGVYNKMK